MLVIAQHNIQDTQKFWSQAKDITSTMPSYLKLHSVFPSKDLRTGTCVWEADSINQVQRFLDEKVGSFSKNTCYEINEEVAIGLPQKRQTAASNR